MRSLALTGALLLLAGCAAAPAEVATAPAPPAATATSDSPPPQFQFLYGSAEAAALSEQAYRMLALYAVGQTGQEMHASAVLAPGATLGDPKWVNCDTKPHAVVFDADETLILNLGVEEHAARNPGPFDVKQWDRWEKTGANGVVAVPGAAAALTQLRSAGITIIVNTNRNAANPAGTIAALKAAGLGDFRHGETLFLMGDVDGKSAKDARRAKISEKYCVVALVGDQLGDFSDLFNAISDPAERRRVASSSAVSKTFGMGWFVLPNPVYGAALKGSYDQVFPSATRWVDPGEAGAN